MPTTTMTQAARGSQTATKLKARKSKTLVIQTARIRSWKTEIFHNLGRQLHTLHIQQQERAFMATSHGLNYRAPGSVLTIVQ